MALPRVLDRIRKLLALAGSVNSHEAEAARKTAERLMARHGVTREEAEALEEDGNYELSLGTEGWGSLWRFSLVTAAARSCGAEALCLIVGRKRRVRLVGQQKDVERAKAVYDGLLAAVRRLEGVAAVHFEEEVVTASLGLPARRGVDAFRRGATLGMAWLLDQAAGASAEPGSPTRPEREQAAEEVRPSPPAAPPAPAPPPKEMVLLGASRRDRAEKIRRKYAPSLKEPRLEEVGPGAESMFKLGLDLALVLVRVDPAGGVRVRPVGGEEDL